MKRVFCILTVAFVIAGLVGCASTGKDKSSAKMMVEPASVAMSKKAVVGLSGQGFAPGEEVVILFTAVDGVVSDIGFALDPQPMADDTGAWATTWKCGRFISKKLIKEGSYTLKAADAEYNVLAEATVTFTAK
ncbi:MAG: hypothetical protein QNJ02_16440 [Desulfobacterales bacterium]|nr:hypothetical protein [Desulfobacterales bacterium]MDJ0876861.1 hypothetical protein [Desulfobacterales bacterium]